LAQSEPDLAKQTSPELIAIQRGARPDNVYNIRSNVEVVKQQPDQAGGFLMAAVILVFVLGIGGFGWKYYNSHSGSGTTAASTSAEPPKAVPQPIVQVPVTQPQSATATEPTATANQASPTTDSTTKAPDTKPTPTHTAA